MMTFFNDFFLIKIICYIFQILYNTNTHICNLKKCNPKTYHFCSVSMTSEIMECIIISLTIPFMSLVMICISINY